MNPFEFYPANHNDFDPRSVFANRVCKLLVKLSGGDPLKAISGMGPMYDDFFEFVRNIYELVEHEIPLFALYELHKHDADNWGFNKEEHNKAILSAMKACENYYG